MTCDDLELLLATADEVLDPAARAHLASCARCRAFEADARAVVTLAAMPAPGVEVQAQLAALAPRVLASWAGRRAEPSRLRRLLGYAVAAGLGALLASGLQWSPARVAAPTPAVAAVAMDEVGAFASLEPGDEDLNVAPEEVFFEVTWPSPEGEFL